MSRPGVRMGFLASVALIALLTVSCGGSASTSNAPSGPPAVGDPAPDFTLKTADGTKATLDDVTAGRPALFYFSMGPG